MLPRSFFSASSLKSPQGHNNSAVNQSGDEDESQPAPMPLQRQRRTSYTAIKRESRSPMSIGHDSEAEMDNEEYVSADSSSQLDSSDDQDHDNTMPSNLQDLMLQLRHQQTKQARYVEKARRLSERMQQTSLRIAQLTGMALEGPTPRSSPSTPRTARKRRDPSPPAIKASPAAELDEDQPLRRTNYAKRTGGPPQSAPAAKVPRRNNDAPVALARRTGPLANPRPTGQTTSPKPNPSHRRPEVEQIKLASRDVCDLFLNRNQDAKTIAFYKKPRSLLFNIAENDSSMKDLLITTSLKGDMQCWNASTRSLITNIGPERFYKNGWIEELCWVTPTTLAMCTGRPKQDSSGDASVLLTHIGKVKRDDVEVRVQTLGEKPHQKEIVAIAPVQLGQAGNVGVERTSFVTGGADHLVCLWDMIRDSPQEDFALADVNKLQISHTNSVQALCYDTYHERLYTGGADSKLFTYDMLSQKSIGELKIGNRINHIMKNPKDPNLMLISQAQTSDQFAIYDQRTPGLRGIQLSFGFSETENVSRYIKPDWHQSGYMVVCGSQSESKVHFWDIRYSGVQRGPCFSLLTQGSGPSRILRTLFVPNRNTLVSVSSTRTMTWTDFTVQPNSKISSI